MQADSAEPHAAICARVFRELKPRTPVPGIAVRFRSFANADSRARYGNSRLELDVTDLLRAAPEAVFESLVWILLAKLFRMALPRGRAQPYRRYMNRKDTRSRIEAARRERGRKQLLPPKGRHYDLAAIFEELNFRHFHGLMAMPRLGWSPKKARSVLGHYDSAHHAIVLSSVLDRPETPLAAVEYVMFHEMLHLRHPVDHRGARRCVHTPEFKAAEKEFPNLREAKEALRGL